MCVCVYTLKLPLPASVFAWASFERERGGRESAHERDRKGERKIDLRKWLMKTQRLARGLLEEEEPEKMLRKSSQASQGKIR